MKKKLLYILIPLSLLILNGCPNAMLGLGDKIDLDPPEISIGTYGDGSPISSGDYVSGEITLKGSVSDDIGIDSVKVSLNGGTSFSNAVVGGSGTTWSYLIDTSMYEDGEKDIIVLVTDKAPTPRTSEDRLLLYFDNTPPVVVVNSPAGYASTSYSDLIINLKGEATDPYRIRSVEVELTGGSGTLDPVEGTNSWNCSFESSGSGAYTFRITAEDYAGNRSDHFYHYDDILPANDNVFITPEDVYKVENGEDVADLTGTEIEAISLTELPIAISLDQDNPVITISNPDPTAQVFDNVLPGNAKFIGSVSDDDGVNVGSISISIDSGPWTPVDVTNGSGLFVTWEHTEMYAVSQDHTLQMKAEDIYGVEEVSPVVNFRINTDAALVDIASPLMSEYIDSSSFTVSGTADDTGGGITDMDISIDNGSTWDPVTTVPDLATVPETVSWDYTTGTVSDGIISIKVRASDDNGGTWSYSNVQVTVDTQAPVTGFTSPAFGSYVNGDVVIRGTSSDNNLLDKVEIKIGDDPTRPGDDGPWILIPDADKYNWTYTIDSLDYENSTDGIETGPGTGIYRLNVYSRATDVAGNITETTSGDHYFYIDNALDSPTVSIIAPQADASLGGSVIVSGTSSDDDGPVHKVEMQIDVNTASGGTPDYSDTSVDLGAHGIEFVDDFGDPLEVKVIDETAWYIVPGTNPWSVEMNTHSELYDTDGAGPHTGDIHIRVRAIDKDGGVDSITGDPVELHFKLDNSIPLINNVSPLSKSYQNDVFHITADVTDETQIKHLEISYDGGTTYHYIIQNGVKQPDPAYNGSFSVPSTDYSMDVEVDTGAIPDIGAVTSDDITIRLKVTDNTNYQSQESLTYYVDNTLPSGWMSQDTNDIYGDGDHAILTGFADDTGTVSGVEKIIAYFEKSGNFHNPLNGSSAPVTTELINGSDVPFPSNTDYHLVIDNTVETLGGANADPDGLAEELNVGTFYEWKFRIDSANLPDGISTLHYVVYDNAGNRFHNTKPVFIKNDKPVINLMKVGYDLDSGGSVQGDEIFTYEGQFKARKILYFEFDASDIGGIASYQVYEGTDAAGTNVLSAQSGEVDINAKPEGVVSYFCQVTDGDGITAETLISVEIDNTDEIDPVFTLHPLTQSHVVDGHLEEDGNSLHDGTDPDVSGTITFTGTASDDQGMEEIRLVLDGVTHTLAAWNMGSFESQDADFSIDSQTINPGSGHIIEWTYTWNTADITAIAKNNVSAVFTVDDFADTPNQAGATSTVDVVPYITDITTGLENGSLSFIKRSALGRYPVAYSTSDTIWISGYNLYPDPDTGTYPSDLVSIGSSNLTITGRDSNFYTFVEARKDSLTSGELTVTTHGIPSINNINDNATNGEPSLYRPNITDDRYIYIWELDAHDTWDGKTQAVMRPRYGLSGTDETTDMDWYYLENGQRVILNGTQLTNSWSTLGGDFWINDDGTPIYIYLHNMNWNSGQTAYPYYGSVQWGKDESYEAAAYNWHMDNTNRLGIGNLSFDTDPNYDPPYDTVVMNRYRNLQILTYGGDTDTDNFVAYYDIASESNGIVFYSFKTGSSLAAGDRETQMAGGWWSNLDKDTPSANSPYPGSSYNVGLETPYNDGVGYTGTGLPTRLELTGGGFDSEHFDMAIDENGGSPYLYIAYYDGSSSKLKLMYNTDPVNNPDTWQSRSTEIDSGAGLYVDMTVDPDHGIHIAYYDASDSNLKYAYLPSYNCLDAAVEVYTVDGLFTNGMYNSITVKDFDESTSTDYRPVISHYSLSFSGTNYALRAAWPVYPLGDPQFSDGADTVSGNYSGVWEVTTVTASAQPSDTNSYVSIDSVRDTLDPQDVIARRTEGEIVIGYNGDYLEEAKLLSE